MRNTKRLFTLLLAILMVFSIIPMSTLSIGAEAPAGDQYADNADWIEIDSADKFLKIGDTDYPATGNYYLTKNLDFSNIDDDRNDTDGLYTADYLVETFNGNLDGRGFALTGFAIEASTYGGVFKEAGTAAVATVSNLKIGADGTSIKATIVNPDNVMFGFLAGQAGDTAAKFKLIANNVTVYGECTYPTAAGASQARCGGFVGFCKDADFYDCSFYGSISVDCSAEKEIDIGGIVADGEGYKARGRNIVIKNCYVDATLTAKHTSVTATERVGGIIGHTDTNIFIDGCTAKGTYTGTTLGGVIGSVTQTADMTTPLCTITDCNLAEANTDKVYTQADAAVRLYVSVDAENAQNTVAKDIGTDTYDENDTNDYVWLIDDKADLAKINGTDLPLDGFYRLASDIDMGGEENIYTTAVINYNFFGVFDGNGCKILNLVIKPEANAHTGFFKDIAFAWAQEDTSSYPATDAVVTDLVFGTPETPAVYEGYAEFAGILAGGAGDYSAGKNVATTDGLYTTRRRAIVDGVDAYLNMTVANATSQVRNGGLIGHANLVYLLDCNTYGNICTKGVDYSSPHRLQLGGMIGTTETYNSIVIYKCNNFANVTAEGAATKTSGTYWQFTGGIVALYYPIRSAVINSNNFGTVTNALTAKVKQIGAGGIFGYVNQTTAAVDCANFGNVYSIGNATGTGADNKTYVGGFTSDMASGAKMNISGFGQYGQLKGVQCEEAPANYISIGSEAKLGVYMDDGAAVRLSADTGLRFKAIVEPSVLARIEKVLGNDATVSKGIIISPDKFVELAGGFTHDKLDVFAENNGFGEEKAYVEVIAEDWFNNSTGKIAGSIINIPYSLYKTNMSGTAFIAISVGGAVCRIYADNVQTKSIYGVAQAALDDVRTESGEVKGEFVYDKELAVGEFYFEEGTRKQIVEGEKRYSCYTKPQRDILNGIITNGDNPSAN